MSSSTATSSHVRTRSLRVPASISTKPVNTPSHQAPTGPSNISLFLTNLRLLNLDLREDWPGITSVTFSTKDALQNQKKRIQCVEWALYHLFAIWDPEETHNKLQPFFPPLEPLQSLNLRTALFRCLDQAKKNGVLGRDTVLRKTMLDECKGERLEEVLAVFSNLVLQKQVREETQQYEPLARQLALEKFSYTGERTVLSSLILAHKASLSNHLRGKEQTKARYRDFGELLALNQRRVTRRHEQLKEATEVRGAQDNISQREIAALQEKARTNWSGNDEWLENLLHGESTGAKDGLLATNFDRVWNYVEGGRVGELEAKDNAGLLQQLESRVRDQEERLARWQAFGEILSKGNIKSSSQAGESSAPKKNQIDLGFTTHQGLQLGRASSDGDLKPTRTTRLADYVRLVESMRADLTNVGKPKVQDIRKPRKSHVPDLPLPKLVLPDEPVLLPITSQDHPKEVDETAEEDWSSASSETELSPIHSYATRSTSQTPLSEPPTVHQESGKASQIVDIPRESSRNRTMPTRLRVPKNKLVDEPSKHMDRRSPPLKPVAQLNPIVKLEPPPPPPQTESEILADDILNSMSAASPSPKKVRRTLSLAERTRMSMAHVSFAPDPQDNFEGFSDIPNLPARPAAPKTVSKPTSETDDKYAGLIERTRKSMVNFEATQKKAQIERRRSVKEAEKKQRKSSFFPKVEEEPPITPSLETAELFEGDPDYESVFKSRPKIKTSPAVSPAKTWEREELYEDDEPLLIRGMTAH
ncbi:hypothetical protein B7463_g5227, partial [Scytalidium lignicola]